MKNPNPASKAQSMIAKHQGKQEALIQAQQILYLYVNSVYWESVINEINNYES